MIIEKDRRLDRAKRLSFPVARRPKLLCPGFSACIRGGFTRNPRQRLFGKLRQFLINELGSQGVVTILDNDLHAFF